jgi:hypothetical protein
MHDSPNSFSGLTGVAGSTFFSCPCKSITTPSSNRGMMIEIGLGNHMEALSGQNINSRIFCCHDNKEDINIDISLSF